MNKSSLSRADLVSEDELDPLNSVRKRFHLPEGVRYFDGNSLGPLPKACRERLDHLRDVEWGRDLIGSWNQHSWIDLPRTAGRKVAPLIGAHEDRVVVCDSVSVNLFKLLSAALELRPDRGTVLCQRDHFPTDLYIAQGLVRLLGNRRLVTLAVDEMPEYLASKEGADVAAVSLGHVDFRSGRLFDMGSLTEAIHGSGALAVWDLSHSAGALPVELERCRVDFAVGCGYKFLNGGPGAPSFLFVAEAHLERVLSPLPGWLGHKDPFSFTDVYEPAEGIDRFICGTPPIVAMVALDAALDVWQGVDLQAVRAKSVRSAELFLRLVDERCSGLGLGSVGPRSADERGSQVCFSHPEGYALMQALIERGVVGDFRAPDILRFGLCPLYQRYVDVWDAVEELRQILVDGRFRDERFQRRGKVT